MSNSQKDLFNDPEITKGFVLEHAAYWSDKEVIGYAMDEAFVHELDVEDLRELVFDLAVRLDSINLANDEFEDEYGDDIHPRDDD